MKTLNKNEVFELIQKEISCNLNKVEDKTLTPEFKLGILHANKRFIDLQQSILDMK